MPENSILYFDYNATTPTAPEVRQAMEPYWSNLYGNPSSLHSMGKEAAKGLKLARKQIAQFFQAGYEQEIIFTSGGTESNNIAVRAALHLTGKKKIVTTAVEHSSIRKFAHQLIEEGYQVEEIPVDPDGRLDLEALRDALTPDTAIVSVMMANNETGIMFPVEEIAKIVKTCGILFHVDAVQAAGKFPICLKTSLIDFLSVSAHKFYGPKGIGILYAKKDAPYYPFIMGGGQERGRRAGTENLPGAVGMAAACNLVAGDFQQEMARLAQLRDLFESVIAKEIPGSFITGFGEPRIPNTSHVRFSALDSETLLMALDQKGVCASSGSACLSGSAEPSHVLKAMGFSDDEAKSGLRFSFGRYSTQEEVRSLIKILSQEVERIRQVRGVKVPL